MALVSLQLGNSNLQSPAGAGSRAVKALRTEQVLEELAMQSARITRLEKRTNELDVQLAASKGRERNLARRVAELEAATPMVTGAVSTNGNPQHEVRPENHAQTAAHSVEVGSVRNCCFPAQPTNHDPAKTGKTPDTFPSSLVVEERMSVETMPVAQEAENTPAETTPTVQERDCTPVDTSEQQEAEEIDRYRREFKGTTIGYHEILKFVESAPDFVRADRNFMLDVVAECGEALQWASDALKANREVVLAAVKQKGVALKFAADNLRDDKDLYLLSMKTSEETCQDGLLFKTAKKIGARRSCHL